MIALLHYWEALVTGPLNGGGEGQGDKGPATKEKEKYPNYFKPWENLNDLEILCFNYIRVNSSKDFSLFSILISKEKKIFLSESFYCHFRHGPVKLPFFVCCFPN